MTIQAQILDLIRDLNEKMNTSVLFITHDLGVVSELCDTVIVMYTGRIVEKAPVRELFNDPKHPYTVGLMSAIPRITKDRPPLETIEGVVPNRQSGFRDAVSGRDVRMRQNSAGRASRRLYSCRKNVR